MADEEDDSIDRRSERIAALRGQIAELADLAASPSEALSAEHLQRLTLILAVIGAEIAGGKGELAEDMWDAFKWEPTIEEKRRGLMWFIEFALETYPADRAAAGKMLADYLIGCWPDLGLLPEDSEIIRHTVARTRSNAGPRGIATKLCETVERLSWAMEDGGEDGFREARRGGRRVRIFGGRKGGTPST